MASIKGQRQSRFNDPITDNTSIKSLHIHKGLVKSADHSISNQSQMEQKYCTRECTKFTMCRNCFWCASILSAKHFLNEECPNCSLDMLDSIPIA